LALRRRRRGRRKKKRKEGEGRGKGRGILIVKQRSANQKREEGGKKEKETNITTRMEWIIKQRKGEKTILSRKLGIWGKRKNILFENNESGDGSGYLFIVLYSLFVWL
jgi:hypothetical protein